MHEGIRPSEDGTATFKTTFVIDKAGEPIAISDGHYMMFGANHDFDSVTTCYNPNKGVQDEGTVFIPDDVSRPFSQELLGSNLAYRSQQAARMIIDQLCDGCPFSEFCPKEGGIIVVGMRAPEQDQF